MRLPAYSLAAIGGLVFFLGSLPAAQPSATEARLVRSWADAVAVKTRLCEDRSTGWYWVYEGLAQGQSFVATGSQVETLRLRVAQLAEQAPKAALEVEIRSANLKQIYLHGTVQPEQVGRQFSWTAVHIDHRVPLEEGKTYMLLLHSRDTQRDAPWLINASFNNPYREGRHLGYTDDLFFALDYAGGLNLVVGPPLTARPQMPVATGRKGGTPMPTRPTLLFGGRTCPPEARYDPLGPIPEGQKVRATVLMAP